MDFSRQGSDYHPFVSNSKPKYGDQVILIMNREETK